MTKRCNQKDCPAPKGLCLEHVSPEYPKCQHWQDIKPIVDSDLHDIQLGQLPLPWKGIALEPEDISLVSNRSNPVIIGMIGTADTGKTTYLSMLFRLLLNGWQFKKWQFGGSYTLSAWESLAQYVVIRQGGKIVFPPPTPSNPDFYSLYHLVLRQNNLFRDLLFADSSGEVFKRWAVDINDSGAENARWIYTHSSAFVLFVDCEALVTFKARAVQDIRQMAEQVAAGLRGRPVVIVWSKADRIGEIKPAIRQSLQEDLTNILGHTEVFEISNFPKPEQDPSHFNDNMAIVSTLLSRVNEMTNSLPLLPPPELSSPDFFLTYRATYATS